MMDYNQSHCLQIRGASPEDLTAANLDKSDLLTALIGNKFAGNPEKLLGELQVSQGHRPSWPSAQTNVCDPCILGAYSGLNA